MPHADRPEFRELHFDTLDDITAHADSLLGQPYQKVKKWSLGQNAQHIAKMMEGSLDGFGFKFFVLFRMFARLFKDRVLAGPMPRGIKGGASRRFKPFLAEEHVTDDQGVDRLRHAVSRLHKEPQRFPSPLLGDLTRDEWTRFHLRHAEMHLGHIVPDPKPIKEEDRPPMHTDEI